MSIQISLIQTLLYSKMIIILFLLQPYMFYIKFRLVKYYNKTKGFRPFFHLIYVIYFMIFIVFLDSTYKYTQHSSALLKFQSERNFYLSGFTLFLALVLNKLAVTLHHTYVTEDKNIDNIKQHKNSMTFVSKVIEDVKIHQETNQSLLEEIEELKEELSKNKAMISEIENNKRVYLALKDKYEKIKEEKTGETKKRK